MAYVAPPAEPGSCKVLWETATTVTLHATQPLPLHCGNTLSEGNNCYNLISPVEVIWLH